MFRVPFSILFCVAALGLLYSPESPAVVATFLDDFEDGSENYQFSLTKSHQIGGGASSGAWSVVNSSGGKALESLIDLYALPESASLAYQSKFFNVTNIGDSRFRFAVDIDVSEIVLEKEDNPEVDDRSVTVALGALGSPANTPGSFIGFKDINDGQKYYIAILTLRLQGDEIDPWGGTAEGSLHLFEHNGDGAIDAVSKRSFKGITDTFTFVIEGEYETDGSLSLAARIESSGGDVEVNGQDPTPLTGTYFGLRTAAFTRTGTDQPNGLTYGIQFDNMTVEKDYQPDLVVGKGNKLRGEGIVNTSGKQQQAKAKVAAGDSTNVSVIIKNIGMLSDSFVVTGDGTANGYTLKYFDGNTNITNQMTGAGYTVSNLAAGAQKTLKLRIEAGGSASGSRQINVRAESINEPGASDRAKVKAILK